MTVWGAHRWLEPSAVPQSPVLVCAALFCGHPLMAQVDFTSVTFDDLRDLTPEGQSGREGADAANGDQPSLQKPGPLPESDGEDGAGAGNGSNGNGGNGGGPNGDAAVMLNGHGGDGLLPRQVTFGATNFGGDGQPLSEAMPKEADPLTVLMQHWLQFDNDELEIVERMACPALTVCGLTSRVVPPG